MNPEFQRNVWLGCAPPRLVSAGAGLSALLALAWLVNGRGFGTITENAALACFVVFTGAWGAQLTSASLISELRGHTWDQQRLSALGPWAMAWGKRAGGPAAAWLCGGLCLAVYVFSIELGPNTAWVILALCSSALGLHAFALIGALLLAQRGPAANVPLSLRLAGAAGLVWLARVILNRPETTIRWFGHDYPATVFTGVVLALLAAWLVFGCYRLMCEALLVRTLPWALAGCVGFLACLVTGTLVDASATQAAALTTAATVALGLSLAASYLAAFAYAPDPLLPRRLLAYARRGQWCAVAQEWPLWGVALGYALVLALGLSALSTERAALPEAWASLAASSWPLLLFASRDLLVFFAIAARAPRGGHEASQLMYLGLAYWLLPSVAALAGAQGLTSLLRPQATLTPLVACAVLLPQVALAALWARRAWLIRMTPQGEG